MAKSFFVLVCLLGIFVLAAGEDWDAFPMGFPPVIYENPPAARPGKVLNRVFPGIAVRSKSVDEDIILGAENPDTVWVIDHDTTIFANIMLLNNAVLEVRGCTLNYRGEIWATGNSQVLIENAVFNLLQNYEYEFMLFAVDSAEFVFRNSTIYSAGMPYGFGAAGVSRVECSDVDFDMAFCTWALLEGCHLTVDNSPKGGEFVIMGDSVDVRIAHSDSVLVWLGFGEGTSGEIHDPRSDAGCVEHFVFPDSLCSGIEYSLEVDSLCGLFIATMTHPASDVVIYDTDIFGAGSVFLGDTAELTGIVNGAYYTSYDVPFDDRTYTLINSSVRTWNFYAYEGSQVSLSNCIFGEFLADSMSSGVVNNSICDGSGGHLGASRGAMIQGIRSAFYTDAIIEDNGIGAFFSCSFLAGRIILSGTGLVFSFDSHWFTPPFVEDSAALFVSALNFPAVMCVDDEIPISGDAYTIRDDDSPFDFVAYRLQYAPVSDTSEWFPITERISIPVEDSALGVWNTHGLTPGQYFLRMWYVFSAYGTEDSIPPTVPVNLLPNTGVRTGSGGKAEVLFYVDPLRCLCRIEIPPVWAKDAQIVVADIGGRVVKSIPADGKTSLVWRFGDIPAGVYLVHIYSGAGTYEGKVLYVK